MTASENKLGQMVLSTLENGEKIVLMVKVNSFMLMVIFMMDFGLMIKLMDLEFTSTLMELNMKECGKMISNTERVLKHGQTNHVMKEITLLAANMVLVAISGMMVHNIWETGKKTRSQVLVSTLG